MGLVFPFLKPTGTQPLIRCRSWALVCQLLGQDLTASERESRFRFVLPDSPHAALYAFPPLFKAKAKLPLSLPLGSLCVTLLGRPLLPLPGCKDHGDLCLH